MIDYLLDQFEIGCIQVTDSIHQNFFCRAKNMSKFPNMMDKMTPIFSSCNHFIVMIDPDQF